MENSGTRCSLRRTLRAWFTYYIRFRIIVESWAVVAPHNVTSKHSEIYKSITKFIYATDIISFMSSDKIVVTLCNKDSFEPPYLILQDFGLVNNLVLNVIVMMPLKLSLSDTTQQRVNQKQVDNRIL